MKLKTQLIEALGLENKKLNTEVAQNHELVGKQKIQLERCRDIDSVIDYSENMNTINHTLEEQLNNLSKTLIDKNELITSLQHEIEIIKKGSDIKKQYDNQNDNLMTVYYDFGKCQVDNHFLKLNIKDKIQMCEQTQQQLIESQHKYSLLENQYNIELQELSNLHKEKTEIIESLMTTIQDKDFYIENMNTQLRQSQISEENHKSHNNDIQTKFDSIIIENEYLQTINTQLQTDNSNYEHKVFQLQDSYQQLDIQMNEMKNNKIYYEKLYNDSLTNINNLKIEISNNNKKYEETVEVLLERNQQNDIYINDTKTEIITLQTDKNALIENYQNIELQYNQLQQQYQQTLDEHTSTLNEYIIKLKNAEKYVDDLKLSKTQLSTAILE